MAKKTTRKSPKKKISQAERTSPGKKRILSYAVYIDAISSIKHFDSIQTILRMATSTILLFCFGILGFIFSSSGIDISETNRLEIGILTSITGLVVITVLCFVDLIFQERLLVSGFLTAHDIEKENEWIPDTHGEMFQEGSHHGEPAKKVWFYAGCGSSLICSCALCIVALLVKFPNELSPIIKTIFIGGLLSGGYWCFLSKTLGTYSKLKDIADKGMRK